MLARENEEDTAEVLKEWLANMDRDLRERLEWGWEWDRDGVEVELHRGARLLGEHDPTTTACQAVDQLRP